MSSPEIDKALAAVAVGATLAVSLCMTAVLAYALWQPAAPDRLVQDAMAEHTAKADSS